MKSVQIQSFFLVRIQEKADQKKLRIWGFYAAEFYYYRFWYRIELRPPQWLGTEKNFAKFKLLKQLLRCFSGYILILLYLILSLSHMLNYRVQFNCSWFVCRDSSWSFHDHILVENTHLTNHIERAEHKIMSKPANKYQIIQLDNS